MSSNLGKIVYQPGLLSVGTGNCLCEVKELEHEAGYHHSSSADIKHVCVEDCHHSHIQGQAVKY